MRITHEDYKGYYSLNQDIKMNLGHIKPEPFTPAQKAWIANYINGDSEQ